MHDLKEENEVLTEVCYCMSMCVCGYLWVWVTLCMWVTDPCIRSLRSIVITSCVSSECVSPAKISIVRHVLWTIIATMIVCLGFCVYVTVSVCVCLFTLSWSWSTKLKSKSSRYSRTRTRCKNEKHVKCPHLELYFLSLFLFRATTTTSWFVAPVCMCLWGMYLWGIGKSDLLAASHAQMQRR